MKCSDWIADVSDDVQLTTHELYPELTDIGRRVCFAGTDCYYKPGTFLFYDM
jgi:hypothetical protein